LTALKEQLIADVSVRPPVDERERTSIRRFLFELDRLGDDPFDEHAHPIHVTASGLIVGARGIVLHRHRILGTWVAPGGHVDPGEAPWDAAVRESAEETGLAVAHVFSAPTLAHVDVHDGPRGHTHLDLRYLLDGKDADPNPPAGESQEIAWFGWDRALSVAEPCMQGIVRHLARAGDAAPA
jgi:8-oxo-dGTP pyrophosphatase MutT (NUDIX family)